MMRKQADKSALELDSVTTEVRLTYALLFGRSDKSKRICEDMFAKYNLKVRWIDITTATHFVNGDDTRIYEHIREDEIGIFKWQAGQPPTLEQFHRYRMRLAVLKDNMVTWKPEDLRDVLYQPGYFEKFTYYTGLVGIALAILSFILGPLTIGQFIVSIITVARQK